jgi:LysM repeat protein
MNSYVHRNNLLNPKWTQVGVGMQIDPRNGMRVFVAVFGVGGQSDGELMVAASAQSAPAIAAAVPPGGMDYTIQPGDTLLEIAQRYNVDWEHVAAINGFSEASLLQIGDRIRLPGAGDLAPGIGGPVSAVSLPDSYIEYVVRSGDTLSGIAARYRLSWQEVAAINGMGEFSVLNLGEVVRIPSPAEKIMGNNQDPIVEVGTGDALRTHVVTAGETVISVADRYGIAWGELLRINGLSEDSVIQIGQELRLP